MSYSVVSSASVHLGEAGAAVGEAGAGVSEGEADAVAAATAAVGLAAGGGLGAFSATVDFTVSVELVGDTATVELRFFRAGTYD